MKHCAICGKEIESGYVRLVEQECLEAQNAGRVIVLPPFEESDDKGLKVKYRVYKARNGEPVENCFVLRPDKDPAARAALLAYAHATPNEALMFGIYSWLEDIEGDVEEVARQAGVTVC